MPVSETSAAPTDEFHGKKTSGRLATILNIFDRSASRIALSLLLILLACVAYRSYVGSKVKPLWYDEIFSIIVATQPTWHAMKEAMPGDGNPPLYALLTKAAIHFFGESRFLIRFPSLVGFLGALIATFV